MASTFELLSQIMVETTEQIRNDPDIRNEPPQMVLVHKATVAGFEKMLADLQRLRELAKSPRITSWVESRRNSYRDDAGGIRAVVELLDLLRSMA